MKCEAIQYEMGASLCVSLKSSMEKNSSKEGAGVRVCQRYELKGVNIPGASQAVTVAPTAPSQQRKGRRHSKGCGGAGTARMSGSL